MPKFIKAHAIVKIQVPDTAQVIAIEDEFGDEIELLRVGDKLVFPALHWMEFVSAARNEGDPVHEKIGLPPGHSFEQVDDDFEERYVRSVEFGPYYLEEVNE